MIRVVLPPPLRTLAGVEGELRIELRDAATQRALLDALEAAHPELRGTLRDRATQARRPYLRFFAGRRDLSHEPADAPLPEPVASGAEPFVVLGALAGG